MLVGAGVEVATRGVFVGEMPTVGVCVGVGVRGVGVGVTLRVTGGGGVGVGVGVGVGEIKLVMRSIPHPPANRQAVTVTPAAVRRAAALQSRGVLTRSRAARISAAVWKR